MIGATCPTCDRIHAYGDVVAVGRFTPGGPTGYRAAAGGPVRATRLEAQRDVCPTWGTTTCGTCSTTITALGPNRMWRAAHPGEVYQPREWVDELNNKAASLPGWHEHRPTAYTCRQCGMRAATDDLTVIGRNCPADDFNTAHVMAVTA